MKTFNVFDTKARVVLAFDPDHLQRLDRDVVHKVLDTAIDLAKIPGFRGCLPCAASGMDERVFDSHILPILTQQKG